MLNLIDMMSQKPAPVIGARFVRGRDMVCGEDQSDTSKDRYRVAARRTKEIMLERKQIKKEAVLALLKTGSYFAREAADKLRFSETNTVILIKELYEEGKLTREKRGFAHYYRAKDEQA